MLRSPSPDANIKELLRCRAGYRYEQSPSVYSQSHSALDDLAVSMLELDDEQDVYDSDEDQEGTSRMSLGPKLNFHSKAPWEADTLHDDDSSSSVTRHTDKLSLRSFQRPSAESSRSNPMAKRSFETTSSRSYPVQTNGSASLTSLISPSPHRSPISAHSSSSYLGSNPPSVILNPDVHPYANPDFALPTEKSRSIPFPVSRSDSTSTLTHPPFSAPVTQPEQHSPRHALQRGEISSPMAINAAKVDPKLIPPTARELVSWVDKGSSPPFTLISLEEARSQRSRSATAQTSAAEDYEMPSNHSPTSSVSSRARVRSISAGAKGNGATPQKPLKHKKSGGFMRLFNAGRDDKTPPPPVPSLTDGYTVYSPQNIADKTTRFATHRVPVPRLESLPADENSSPKRTPPALSINVPPITHLPKAPATSIGQLAPTRSNGQATFPKSAPPNISQFPALKLRPVSTVFSAQFGDHILSHDLVSSPDGDSDTQSSLSTNTLLSPVTPNRPDRLSDDKSSSILPVGSDDQSSIIRALQEQIVTAKKVWQRQIWELEGQVRDLKAEVEELRGGCTTDFCQACGATKQPSQKADQQPRAGGVINRPRARTGVSRYGAL